MVDVVSKVADESADIAAAADSAIRNRLGTLRAEGASEEQLLAFAEAADRRYSEALEEIAIQAELNIMAADPPSSAVH